MTTTFTDFYTTSRFAEFESRFRADLVNFLNQHNLSAQIKTSEISVDGMEYCAGTVNDFWLTHEGQSANFVSKAHSREIKHALLYAGNFHLNETDGEFSFNVSLAVTTQKTPQAFNLLAKFTYSYEGRLNNVESFVPAQGLEVPVRDRE